MQSFSVHAFAGLVQVLLFAGVKEEVTSSSSS